MPARMVTESSGHELHSHPSSQMITCRKNKNENSRIVTPSSSTLDFGKQINATNMRKNDDPVLISSDEDENAVRRKSKKFNYQEFNDKRVMSALQERWNAITMIPVMLYGFYFILAGCWLTSEHIEMVRQRNEMEVINNENRLDNWMVWAKSLFGDAQEFQEDSISAGCISISWLPHFHALPPLPVIAGAMGVVTHAPFSFLYHWRYATKLHPSKRLEHWSRRLDHAFIHFASACMAYATSGNINYFALNAVYNLDCAYKQFEEKVRPRRNQTRIAMSILLYILPVFQRECYGDFAQLILIFTLGGWFFITYPIGGWSHAMFHLVIAFLPHVIMVSACKLSISQQQLELAAQCAVRTGK